MGVGPAGECVHGSQGVTYFGGDEGLKLGPDLDGKQIWLDVGIPPNRVLPFGTRDNFWEMGETDLARRSTLTGLGTGRCLSWSTWD